MLASFLRGRLANDINFRLALNKAVKAKPPLNAWVIQNVLSDPSFRHLFCEILRLDVDHPESIYQREEDGTRRFQKLSSDKRISLMVSEWMDRSNERLRVLAGLASRLEGLLSYLGRSKSGQTTPKPEGTTGISASVVGSWNPLLQWGLAGVLGVTTVGTAGTVLVHSYQISHEVSRMSQNYSHDSETIKEKIENVKECTETKPTCCEQQTAALSSLIEHTIALLDHDSKATRTALNRVTNKIDLGVRGSDKTSSSEAPPAFPNPLIVKLDGIPSLQIPLTVPNSLHLAPSYRLDSLPTSTGLLSPGTPTPIKVEYPESYVAVRECTFTITLKSLADTAELGFEKDKSCNLDRIAPKALIRLKLNQNPIYIPELDALIGLTSQRQGFLRGSYRTSQISIQPAPYYPRTLVPNTSPDSVIKTEAAENTSP